MLVLSKQRSRDGSALKNLKSQRSLKNDQFPKMIVGVNSVLSDHEFNKIFDQSKKSRSKKKVDDEEDLTLPFDQLECTCYCCGKKGHTSTTCHFKDKLPKY